MKRLDILVLVIFTYVGCSKNDSERIRTIDSLPIEIESFNKTVTNFSDVITTYKLLKLQTKNAPLIGDVKKLICTEANIFIQDALSNKVYLFDTLGNYKTSFGSLGEGPSEYRGLDDFLVDINQGNLYLLDGNSRKICVYNIEGKFVKYYNLNFFSFRFEKNESNFVFITGGDCKNNLYITDSDFKMVSEIRPKSVKTRILIIKPLSKINDNVLAYTESMTDTIFTIENKKVTPYFYVESGSKSIGKLSNEEITAEFFKDNRVLFDKILEKYHTAPDMLVGNGEQLKFMIGAKDNGYIVFFDKSTNDYKVIDSKTKDDICFTAYPCNFTATFKDYFVGVVPAYLLVNANLKNFKPKNLSRIQMANFDRITKQTVDLSEASNPIILFAKAKINN